MITLADLHPRLQDVLRAQGWEALSPAQEAAWEPATAGDHVLLVAPTGHGKTEAAMLPVLHRLLAARDRLAAAGKPWPTGFKALYVTPLRALNRDLMGRLESWAEHLGLHIGVRHGDTSQAERARQSRRPPDILITTPETVQLLLYGDRLRAHLRTVQSVILDEVHDLAAAERGAQLMVALERIEEVRAQPMELRRAPARTRSCPKEPHYGAAPSRLQRLGLSATVADAEAVARFMAGSRPVQIRTVLAEKKIELSVRHAAPAPEDEKAAARLAIPPEAAAQLRHVRQIAAEHERVLVFHNTRDSAELSVSRSAMLDEEAGAPQMLELHHGSLSKEHREHVEQAFKAGDIHALVATSSLELGIDVGAIDHVIQVHSPRSVARMVQRIGRAGHRMGLTSAGTVLADGPEDILECIAVAEAVQEGRLEPLRIRNEPLTVLANQLVALVNEYRDLQPAWTYQVVRRAGPFLDLEEGLFDAVWQALLDVETLYPSQDARDALARSGRARRHFLENISLIPDERKFRVIDEASKRSIGTVDDSFVAAGLSPGTRFIMAGRNWSVLELEPEEGRIRVAPAKDLGSVPQWSGSQLPVSAELADAVARLRGQIAEGTEILAERHGAEAMAAAAEPIQRQLEQGLQVPTHQRVTIDVGRGIVIVNVALGTRGNEALGRITQALLHQRSGSPVAMEADAYRIQLNLPRDLSSSTIEDVWDSLDPESLDVLVGRILRDSPLLRHHLVQVAKGFGALPKILDPNRFSRSKLEMLLGHMALQEETVSRLIHDRLDLERMARFLRERATGAIEVVHQAVGPISLLGQQAARGQVMPLRRDDALLAAVRDRIDASDVLLVCTACRNQRETTVAELPPRIHCRRCGSIQVACLRPWNEEAVALLGKPVQGLSADQRRERARLDRNASLVGTYGRLACRALVARGVGPDTAVRILQKTQDPDQPLFWREILAAELQFARTHAFWQR